MGREIKRVPIDFGAPLNEVWAGYRMSDDLRLPTCPDCNGYTRDATYQWVEGIAQLLLMVGEDIADQQRGRPLHPYLSALTVYTNQRPADPSATALSGGLAGRHPRGWGHDAIDCYSATKAIIEAAGLDYETWAVCTGCEGRGNLGTPEQVAAYDAWERSEPPTGDGWQLWETVSEGSPISPVFATSDELASWMSDPAREQHWVPGHVAAQFIADGWAPTFVSTPETGLVSGVEFVGTTEGGER
ncbi:hypothetical protein [Polymorphospora lycopeni]|uniref:Uncharacterized protein n=1 Tax=Polymorphospora lycopeni TaxID=3140240 RepID=A0ABV5CKV5_9ACTN